MRADAKVWNTTKTGFKVHAFQNGVAICRSNIREGIAPAHSGSTARRWVLDTPGLSFCVDCHYRFDFLVSEWESASAQREADHAEALATAEPKCVCPRMEPPAKFGHHVVCPLRATDTDSKENNEMANEGRRRTGPLSDLHQIILDRLAKGERQKDVAESFGYSESYISAEINLAATRMNVRTTAQACATWATARTYREAADLIDADRPLHPEGDEVDEHVWHILDGLARILRERADKLLPS